MCDKELLVSHVYDELDVQQRKLVQQHLATCRDCREEAQRLRSLRTQLGAWTVAEVPLNLRIAPSAAARRRVPGWALAAAAVLVLAVASAIAGIEIQAIEGGLRIGTKWSAPVPAPPLVQAASREELEALQRQILDLEAALASARKRPEPVVAAPLPSGPAVNDSEIMRRVARLIRESEDRQQQVLATRLIQGMRELQAAHSSDLTRLERALNQQHGIWTDEMLRQREEIKQMYRVVSQQQLQR